jgi:hypothetical protein
LVGGGIAARQLLSGSPGGSPFPTQAALEEIAPPPAELGVDDPRTVELPQVADRPAATTWIKGDGKRIVRFVEGSADLARLDAGDQAAASGTCRAVVARLRTSGDADFRKLAEVASGAPDEQLAGVLLNDIAAKGDLLRTCDDSSSLDARAGEVRFTHVVAGRLILSLMPA